ncbi:MAG: sigma-70 family RNA polymerase sigma factor [Candidatus Eremiobacteraeota bacterium]|nr:sigma-70 family RNA polymerase sigma factor [Candidatus Eremiobacteraeota bacterium]
MEDADLLMARVAERDVAAFEAVYDRYYRLVYGIAFKLLADEAAAEDVTQAVFLKIWSAPRAFGGGMFSAWIARVARNRALDVVRSRKAHEAGELPADLPLEGTVDDTVFARLDSQRVRTALAELPDEQRDPIELGFFSGITHEEIARRTGTPLGTVKTRIRTGLRRLRSALEASAV